MSERHPALVDSVAALEACFQVLGRARAVAMAAQDNGMHAYRPEVCLVQLAVTVEAEPLLFAIDPAPFRGQRPHPLAALGRHLGPTTTVLVHGGDYAVAGLRRDFHLRFGRSLIDTQQAAVLLGLPETGYKSLCRALLGVEVGPPVSRNWRERPLGHEAVVTALDGVAHLPKLWEVLAARIADKDLSDELALASLVVAETSERANQPDPRKFRHIEGASGLSGLPLALLAAIVQWRDAKARAFDCPPGRVLPNPQVVALARAGARAADAVSTAGFHSRLVWNDREELRRLVVRVVADPGSEAGPPPLPPAATGMRAMPLAPAEPPAPTKPFPKKGPPTPLIRARMRALKAWRREEATRREVGLQAILPGIALEHLAFFGAAELGGVPQLGTRRIVRYAADLVRLCETEPEARDRA